MTGKRYALNIDSSKVNEDHYGSSRLFGAAEKSAKFFSDFFEEERFTRSILLKGDKASSASVKNELDNFASIMKEGDLFVMTFCGHTDSVSQGLDVTNSINEDEGWALTDRVFFHFEIWQCLQHFCAGVQVIILSDTCYSDSLGVQFAPPSKTEPKSKTPWFETHRSMYNSILEKSGKPGQHAIPPSVVIVSASGENDEIAPADKNERTVFSNAFQYAWERQTKAEPKFVHNLSSLFDDIVWYVHVKLITTDDVKRHDIAVLHDNAKVHKRRITPQWHYNQGHKYTNLRVQKPPFKEGNY